MKTHMTSHIQISILLKNGLKANKEVSEIIIFYYLIYFYVALPPRSSEQHILFFLPLYHQNNPVK